MAKLTATPALSAPGGSLANLTFVRQPDGTASMRERKPGRDPRSPAQEARREAVRRVSRAWSLLSDPERAAWEAHALRMHELGPTPSLGRARAGYRVFSGLGLKALQVAPEGAVPSLPPAAAFYGDGARVAAPAPSGVAFVASAPNSAGIVTELLLQPLASPGRKGEADKYRTRGFVALAYAGQEVVAPCGPGVVLCAVRFVEAATGQASGLVPLGRVVVG